MVLPFIFHSDMTKKHFFFLPQFYKLHNSDRAWVGNPYRYNYDYFTGFIIEYYPATNLFVKISLKNVNFILFSEIKLRAKIIVLPISNNCTNRSSK